VRTVAEMAQPRRREPRGGVSRSFRCRVYLFCTEILEVRPPPVIPQRRRLRRLHQALEQTEPGGRKVPAESSPV